MRDLGSRLARVMDFETSLNVDTPWDFMFAGLLLREGRAPVSLSPGRR